MTEQKTLSTKSMTKIALVTAIMCILGPLSIPLPFSPVPISLIQFSFYLAIFTLDYKKASIATIVYILLGTVGIPVFSSFGGGFSKLLGPTGGYIFGYVFITLIGGYFLDNFYDNKPLVFLGIVLGNMICYVIGTFWLGYQGNMTFIEASMIGVVPYIIGDIIKICISMSIGYKMNLKKTA